MKLYKEKYGQSEIASSNKPKKSGKNTRKREGFAIKRGRNLVCGFQKALTNPFKKGIIGEINEKQEKIKRILFLCI